ncbi:unnamed protein product [Rotaria sordida]|uniref:Uncharacterized protein n=1 Tax=Rotaria sordida TaxID=392033 RepID=A0A815FDZ8_9BILA|nr:unnamed protein product [Rotaria sordida]CAF1322198.1 unnamed protein product [Rotaria sordida]
MSLFEACQKVDIEQVKYLIEQNFNINKLNEQGRTALHYCCDHENIDCARLLLENDKSIINIKDNEGFSALHLACLNGNLIMVKYFCEQGADVTLVDNELHSLIHWITVCGHVDLFDILVQYQTPIHTSDIYGAFPIHYASQLCGNNDPIKILTILKKLIDNNADVNCLDEQKRTPFIWAASANAIDALRILYKAGANPLHADKDSLTALHCAATCGHLSCIRMLIELYGCSLESEDINGCTPLFYAITFEHLNVCRVLLHLKANPNHKDHRGRTPSHCAALKGNINCLKCLIEHNADIWIKNKRGDYPIHEAINSISFSKFRNEKNDQLQRECLDFVRFILQLYPKKVNIQNSEHRTSLHLAANFGDVTMCKILIECGARVNSFIQTTAGNFLTPYDLARIRHQDKCAEYLVYNHGGQRGNLLAHILARRIQKYFRQYKMKKPLIENQQRKTLNKIFRTNNNNNNNRNSFISENLSSQSTNKLISTKNPTDHLLNQAKLCLHNKIIDDQCKELKINSSKSQIYLINNSKEEKQTAKQRRHIFAEFKTTMKSINCSDEHESNSSQRIIIHPSNSITTSVKLYERHKLIAEELFKIKEARIHNHSIIINRRLYKILIENAFNPQNRSIDEIEKYLETLLKAYETELESIRKRTKVIEYTVYILENVLKLTMKNTEIDDSIDNTDIPNTTTGNRSTKNKPAPKAPTDETQILIKTSENKRKAPKIPITTNIDVYERTDETETRDILEKENNFQESSIFDQEIPVKSKKKRAPKFEIPNENDELIPIEETITKKKSKAPKPPINDYDDDDNDSQNIETLSMDLLESSMDIKPKKKKSKKSKLLTETFSTSFDDLNITNLDEIYSPDQEIDVNTNDTIPIDDIENVQSSENNTSEYETAIINAYSNLASNVHFSQYFGDEWRIAYLPKPARTDEKSLIRKILPGGNKDEKSPKKTTAPKGGILTRLRNGVSTLVRDENNMLFGERSNIEKRDYGDDPDDIDTDNLNRYAQKLRDLEDRDREINPEYLVLRDGKTLYAVHESDADGTVKLAKRKPIFDRFADQKINDQSGKKTILSRLKSSFSRSKDIDDNDSQSLKLDGDTSNTRLQRKSSKKSFGDDINMVAYDDLGMD